MQAPPAPLLTIGLAVPRRRGWVPWLWSAGVLVAVVNLPWLGGLLGRTPIAALGALGAPWFIALGNAAALVCLVVGLLSLVLQRDPSVRLARRLTRRGDHHGAAELYLRTDDVKKALACYHRAHAWSDAADLALASGLEAVAAADLRRAGGVRLEEAARLYRLLGDPASARDCARELAEWYTREQRFADAVGAWLRSGDAVRAARAAAVALETEQLGPAHPELPAARRAAEDARDPALLARLHELTGSWQAAARSWERAGDGLRAAEAYRRGGSLREAADRLEQSGRTREALQIRMRMLEELADRAVARGAGSARPASPEVEALGASLLPRLEELGMEDELLGVLQLLGRIEAATERLVARGEVLAAAEIARESQRWELAARLLERSGRWGEASDFWELAGELRQAAGCAERSGEDERAAELYGGAGMLPERARCLTRTGRARDALVELHRAGEMEALWAVLREQPGPVPDLPDVVLDLAQWLREAGRLEEAVAALQRAVVGVALTAARREPALALARLLAEAGERDAALAQVERVLEVDFAFTAARDLRQQLQDEVGLGPDSTRAPGRTPGAAGPAEERYSIVTELGRGGMGVVYRAWDRRLEREVAIKVLRTTASHELARLEEEAKSAATLNHPGIVVVHDFDAGFGGYFIAMEFIEGRPLDQLLRDEPHTIRARLLPLLVQVAEAVAYAHSRRVVHRDLKPGNILLTHGGTIKIHDFGIATRLAAGGPTGGACGTPFYMAPEQVRGETTTPATDVYCLGATFFHLATGRPPFPRGNIIAAHLEKLPPRPDGLARDLPDGLADVILRCLEKDPAARFPTAAELARALSAIS